MFDQSKIDKFADEVTAHRKAVQEKGKELLKELIADVFANPSYADLEAVRWEQYTPYFNDGDTCYFSVYDVRVKVKGMSDEEEYEDGFVDTYGEAKKYAFLDHAIHRIGDDILEDAFGDHAQVTITREGITVEEYEHE